MFRQIIGHELPKYNDGKHHVLFGHYRRGDRPGRLRFVSEGTVRLDRFVSHAGGCSRKEARQLIRHGQIQVNGAMVCDEAFRLGPDAEVKWGDERLQLPQRLYLMMNKPVGLISATKDRSQPTVLSLLPPDIAERVHLVGRLDKDTSGLLLLTDDGTWSHAISAPRRRCAKTYIAQLAEPLVEGAEQRFAQGLMLRGERHPTQPATLVRLPNDAVRISISEGRYHQVKRMFAVLGNRVLRLHREAIGDLMLDDALTPGEWRVLSKSEREQVLADV